jgi:hypothetical protein
MTLEHRNLVACWRFWIQKCATDRTCPFRVWHGPVPGTGQCQTRALARTGQCRALVEYCRPPAGRTPGASSYATRAFDLWVHDTHSESGTRGLMLGTGCTKGPSRSSGPSGALRQGPKLAPKGPWPDAQALWPCISPSGLYNLAGVATLALPGPSVVASMSRRCSGESEIV